jgi:hypothetical protein
MYSIAPNMIEEIKRNNKQSFISKIRFIPMAASWSLSHTLGTKEKAFSWWIDSRGNIFIRRKFRKALFPRIDKISCSQLDKLQEYMQDKEWKSLANGAAKLDLGTEKDGIGKFLYMLRPEVPYAQLSSQLAAIFYHSGVWEWNEQKKGMKFLLLSCNWKEKTAQYYRNSLDLESESRFMDGFSENSQQRGKEQEELQEAMKETMQEEPVRKIEQTKLSAFFGL